MDTSSSWRASAAALTRRVRRCAWILLALCGLGLSLPAAAQHTQRSAYAACVADAQMNYNSNLAMHGPAYVKPWYCTLTDLGSGNYAYSSVNHVDVYHNGNFTKIERAISGFSTATYDPAKGCGPAACGLETGNPINLVTGAKTRSETDLAAATAAGMSFTREYLGDAVVRPAGMLGARWRSHYDRRIVPMTTEPATAIAFRQRGNGVYFTETVPGVWTSDSDTPYRLQALMSGTTLVGWTLTDLEDREETYDADGRLTRVQWPDGDFQQLDYDPSQRLVSVVARDGRALTFAYDLSGRLSTLTDATGAVTTYAYDATSGLLSSVTYPDSAVRAYLYNETGHVVSPPAGTHLLTGIQDENGQRYASVFYDSAQRAITSTLAGNAERVDVTYGSGTAVTLVDALGRSTTRSWAVMQRTSKFTGASGISVSSGSRDASRTHDAAGYPNLVTDFKGSQTDHDYNARGLETQRIEAANDTTGRKRTVQTDWHAGFRSPTERRIYNAAGTLKARTAWTYNARNQALTATGTDPATAATRTTTMTYCEAADVTAATCPYVGLLKSVNGARTDVVDLTIYTYRQTDGAGCATAPATCPYRKGDAWKVTNALGQITEVLAYDGAGRVLSLKDANGVVTDLEYDTRGRLTARKLRGTNPAVESDDQITRIEYWPTGLVKKVTQPDGGFTAYTYDNAHRLTGIADNQGNSIAYTLDAAGERTAEQTRDHASVLVRTLSRTYNLLGQLQTQTDAYGRTTGVTHDANGNPDAVTDALGRITDQNHDPLDRLARTLQDVGGIAAETMHAYDALDNLVQVKDPKGLDTDYTYNGFSDLLQIASPDTGSTGYTYDSAGNRATQTDARGITTTYGHDALNRPTAIIYPTSSLNVGFTYDTAQPACVAGETFTVGRLVKMTDGSGDTVYCYNRFGHLVRKVQTTNGRELVLRYVYNAAGQLTGMVYPGGATVDYVHDAQGRVVQVGLQPAGGTRQVVVNNVVYYPFGPAAQWRYGNSLLMQRSLNQNYEPGFVEAIAHDGIDLGYEFDDVGNLTALRTADQTDPPLRTYDYDALNRLTATKDGTTSTVLESYTYDKTGNRGSATVAGITTAYTYPAGSHRLAAVGGTARAYDNAGNTTQIALATAKNFVYGAHGRMTQAKDGATVKGSYTYNGRGEQVRRYLGPSSDFLDVYDEDGRWIGDYRSQSGLMFASRQQIVWLGDLPVAVLVSATPGVAEELYYIQPDALGTPRVVVDPAIGSTGLGEAVWTWDLTGEAFGTTAPNQDADGDGLPFVFDMRFPGQRYDAMSGLNYNYFRDYEAETGRYVQSDPIGLEGGLNLYRYSYANPLRYFDPSGLTPRCRPLFSFGSGIEDVLISRDIAGDTGWYLLRASVDPPSPGRPRMGQAHPAQAGGMQALGFQSGSCWGKRIRSYRETYGRYEITNLVELCTETDCGNPRTYLRAGTIRRKISEFDRIDHDGEITVAQRSAIILQFRCMEWARGLK